MRLLCHSRATTTVQHTTYNIFSHAPSLSVDEVSIEPGTLRQNIPEVHTLPRHGTPKYLIFWQGAFVASHDCQRLVIIEMPIFRLSPFSYAAKLPYHMHIQGVRECMSADELCRDSSARFGNSNYPRYGQGCESEADFLCEHDHLQPKLCLARANLSRIPGSLACSTRSHRIFLFEYTHSATTPCMKTGDQILDFETAPTH